MKNRYAAIALLLMLSTVQASAGEKPNVLFIAVDDLKPMLGCYGDTDVLTPNIDSLAQRGTVFLNASCQQSVCAPSRASLMTGTYADTTKVYDLKTQMRKANPHTLTLPEYLRRHGYETTGTGKIYDPRSVDKSFDAPSWTQPFLQHAPREYSPKGIKRPVSGYQDPEVQRQVKAFNAWLKVNGITEQDKEAYAAAREKFPLSKPTVECLDLPDEAYDDGIFAICAMDQMKKLAEGDKPFFLAVGMAKPHLPFVAPKKYWDLYDRSKIELAPFQHAPANAPDFAGQPSWELRHYSGVPASPTPIPQEMQRELIHGYRACVSYIDAQIGKVLDQLDELGLADNTIVVLWGDHGWHLGDHGMFCKHTNYEQAVRSPLIIAAPRQKATGVKTDSPSEFVDIFPTLCELVGLPVPESVEGLSLQPILDDPDAMVHEAALEQYPRNPNKMGYTLRDKRYRYIKWIEMDYYGGERSGPMVANELTTMKTIRLKLSTSPAIQNTKTSSPTLNVSSRNAASRRKTNMKIERRVFIVLCMAFLQAGMLMADDGRRPNIVFFIADDMLPRHFNCLPEGKGKNLTPNIDRLTREGTVMTEQHVCSPVCTPSRYNVLTGNYASRANNAWFKSITKKEGQSVVGFNTHIIKSDTTLPGLLKRAGYTTGMVGKNHVVEVAGLKRFPDFDASAKDPANESQLKANHDRVCQAIGETGFDYVDRVYHNNPDFLGLHDVAVQNMDWITEGGVDFIGQPRDKPFFLYFATTVPHGPTTAKRSWNADPRVTAIGYLDKAPDTLPARDTIPDRLIQAGFPVNDDTANMLWLDDAVGSLFDKLEATGQLNDTVFFFCSDHGQGAKGTLYQGGVHNPSIVWKKGGFPVGPQSDALVSIVDFAPTILDIARADDSHVKFDGESFLPYLNGTPQEPGRVLYFELGYARAIRKDNWKYMAIRYPEHVETMTLDERAKVLADWNAERRRMHLPIVTEDPSKPFSHLTAIPGGGHAEATSTGAYPGYFDRDQLYDLANDPGELHNLAGDPAHAETLRKLRLELVNYVNDLPGGFAELATKKTEADSARLESHTITQNGIRDYSYFSDEYIVHTNLWGARAMKDAVPEFTFNLRYSKSKPLVPIAYDWSISEEFSLPIFPYYGYGDRMWKEKRESTTTKLPIRVRDLRACDIHYKLKIDEAAFRKAKGNLTVDVWLGDQPTNNDHSMRTEIMLWFDHANQTPIGAKNHQGTYEFGGVKWDLFIGEFPKGATVVNSFIAQRPVHEGTIDFLVPLNIVKEKGHISDATFLGGFELGNEIFKGGGSTTVKQFHVDVQPKGFPQEEFVHEWRFLDRPISKCEFDGTKGFDTKVENSEAVSSRTVMARFTLDDVKRRQVIYKEGGADSGLSIYVSSGKIHVANWNTVDNEVERSIVSSPVEPQADAKRKRPAEYFVVAAAVESSNKTLTAFVNGKKVGARPFHGLAANRGTTTLGYTDGPLRYYTGLSEGPAFLKGVIDDVLVFNKRLTAEEIGTLE
ncbi:sulfatase-like hydrolase/transferase [Rhodopirellula sp. ICT_H3.1]|uniref:Sulfatase-like hydrolase/transferase n=2 Tax=Aporhodopirellula aestuarii TaxID=2950107 RepID=A0ABT0UEG9_9BACT|nr:sulfatase-like hydrolase/transferase [Aporhodopirellula aestuarii]